MKRFIVALRKKLSRPKVSFVDDQSSDTVSVENLVMPDIYADENAETVPDLNPDDLSPAIFETSAGFNPYDTAALQKTKHGIELESRKTAVRPEIRPGFLDRFRIRKAS